MYNRYSRFESTNIVNRLEGNKPVEYSKIQEYNFLKTENKWQMTGWLASTRHDSAQLALRTAFANMEMRERYIWGTVIALTWSMTTSHYQWLRMFIQLKRCVVLVDCWIKFKDSHSMGLVLCCSMQTHIGAPHSVLFLSLFFDRNRSLFYLILFRPKTQY